MIIDFLEYKRRKAKAESFQRMKALMESGQFRIDMGITHTGSYYTEMDKAISKAFKDGVGTIRLNNKGIEHLPQSLLKRLPTKPDPDTV